MSNRLFGIICLVVLVFIGSLALADTIQVEGDGILNEKEYFYDNALGTFSVPFFYSGELDPEDERWDGIKRYGHRNTYVFNNNNDDCIEEIYEYQRFLDFAENDEEAEEVLTSSFILTGPFYNWRFGQYFEEGPFDIVEDELFRIDGHYARLAILHTECEEVWGGAVYISSIVYIRNDEAIAVSFIPDHQRKVTMEDLRTVASLIIYDESKADWTANDGEFSLESKDNATVLIAGKKTQLLVNYNDPKKANEKIKSVSNTSYIKKYGSMIWSVLEAETGNPIESGISIDSKINLIVDKSFTETKKVVIKAESTIFHSSAEYPITIIPAASSISVDKEELLFYAGTDSAETVKVTLDPETIPPIGITWKAQKDGIIEITPSDDGTATIKPVTIGKTVITITEPGGKNVRMNASVVTPVEQVELKLSGKQIPGGKVSVKETLAPKNVGNKKVEWSLNVDESIATINEKGQVSISKEAVVGTKIIVTCKALGAPEPVVSQIEFDIVEK